MKRTPSLTVVIVFFICAVVSVVNLGLDIHYQNGARVILLRCFVILLTVIVATVELIRYIKFKKNK